MQPCRVTILVAAVFHRGPHFSRFLPESTPSEAKLPNVDCVFPNFPPLSLPSYCLHSFQFDPFAASHIHTISRSFAFLPVTMPFPKAAATAAFAGARGLRSASMLPVLRPVFRPAVAPILRRYYADKMVQVPQMAESISEGTLRQFTKQVGDYVAQDEEIATIETDKVSFFS